MSTNSRRLESSVTSGVGLLTGKTVTGTVSARVRIDGVEYINFFGSTYLALANIPEIRAAAREALEDGAPFARAFMSALGTRDPIFDAVEQAAALACGTESSVYFSSGYLIGMVGLASHDESFDMLAIDELAHYSLKDAVKLCGIPTHAFAHCDAENLSDLLQERLRRGGRPLVLTDGVFATSGRVPPLAAYASILEHYNGRLFVDESHGFGVVGESGRGASELCGVEDIASTGATLSKALCAQGAIIGCSAAAAERLQSVPSIRGACAGSPLSAAAATASLLYVAKRPELRQQLRALAEYLRQRLRRIGFCVIDTPAPIVAFRYGTRLDMLALQRRAFQRHIYCYHSDYIGAGAEGVLRCAVFRDHTKEDIDAFIDAIG